MHVGLVVYGSLETLSGGYLYDRALVTGLQQAGDQVTVVSLPWRNYPRHLTDNVSTALARRLRGLRVDVLLQDELNHPSLFLLNYSLRRALPYPLISIVHHLRSSEQHPALARWFYRPIERRYLRSVQGFVFNSRTTQAEVRRLIGREAPGVVAYPGGDQFGDGIGAAAIVARANQPGPLRLLFVGNLIERKGLHHLLAALTHLPQAGWSLDVVGQNDVDPAYAARMARFVDQQGLHDRVRFWGRLPQNSLRELWLGSHVLVVPSQYEGFGIVYLEGFSFGLPALASSAGAASEIVTDGQDGFLLASGDERTLAAHLAELISDRALLTRMSLAARQRFSDFPTWQETAFKIREYLQTMLQ